MKLTRELFYKLNDITEEEILLTEKEWEIIVDVIERVERIIKRQ